MKISALLVTSLFIAACGGGKSKGPKAPASPPPDAATETPTEDPAPEDEAEKPGPPPPPKQWHAEADLAPVKGVKMKAGVVKFLQTEGEGVEIMSGAPFDGLKPGTYHLVIHEAADCGKNATKVGAALPASAAIALDVTVAKQTPGEIDQTVELTLDGDDTIVGHTLVLHADKKGKAGKVVACGSIKSTDDAAAAPVDAPGE